MPYTANLIPTMTSATAPSGVASSDGNYNSTYVEWKAFNHANAPNDEWFSVWGAGPWWLQYQFPTAHTVTRYAVTANYDGPTYSPNTWTFKGSNDGSAWTTLHTQTNITAWGAYGSPLRRVYDLTNTTAYAYYRLDITVSNYGPGASLVAVGELEMMETVPPPPPPLPTLGVLATLPAQTVVVTCSAWLGGSWQADLHVTAGSVTADSRRSAMRDATITVAPDETLSHAALYDLLSTPGLQLQVSRGFQLADGTQVMAPLGVFIVDQLTYKRTAAGSELDVTCTDLSERVTRARWTQPYQIAVGTPLADAINAAVLDRWPSAQSVISQSDVPNVIGAQAVFEAGGDSDPWADISALAQSFGYLLSFSPTGVLQAQSVAPLADASPVFTFAVGATAIMTSQTKIVGADQSYNGVVVTGESSENDTPPRGEAWDLNPSSPTYLYGPFGAVPKFYSSPFITTTDQAETVAVSMLTSSLGKTEQLSWEQVVHPGLQPLNVVAVEFPDGPSASYVLDCLTIPLAVSDAMSAAARSTTAAF